MLTEEYTAFLQYEIDKRKEARNFSSSFTWTTTKLKRLRTLAEFLLQLSKTNNINHELLGEVILNKLVPLNKNHVPFTRLISSASDYFDSLAETTVSTLVACQNWTEYKPFIVSMINKWNKLTENTTFLSNILRTTGQVYRLRKAVYYGNDFLPALNLLVKFVKLYNYETLYIFIKDYFKNYVIVGCRHYAASKFTKDFHLYHITANDMPMKLLPKLTIIKSIKTMKKEKQDFVDIDSIKYEIYEKWNVDTFPITLSPLQYKKIKGYAVFLEIFYKPENVPLGKIYKRRPIAVLQPSLFTTITQPVKVKLADHIDEFKVI